MVFFKKKRIFLLYEKYVFSPVLFLGMIFAEIRFQFFLRHVSFRLACCSLPDSRENENNCVWKASGGLGRGEAGPLLIFRTHFFFSFSTTWEPGTAYFSLHNPNCGAWSQARSFQGPTTPQRVKLKVERAVMRTKANITLAVSVGAI